VRGGVRVQFTVGLKLKGKTDHIAVDAEYALIAALKVKTEYPEAMITYDGAHRGPKRLSLSERRDAERASDVVHGALNTVASRPEATTHGSGKAKLPVDRSSKVSLWFAMMRSGTSDANGKCLLPMRRKAR
jgi:hypothetical protein